MVDPGAKTAILAKVDSFADDIVKLTQEMVHIPSVNPTYPGEDYAKDVAEGGETKCSQHLVPVLESLGLKTDLWAAEAGRSNVAGVYKGTGGGKTLIFNGHIDVVPPGPVEDWTVAGPWSGDIVNGRVYGRGSCDMKGGIASAIYALKAVLSAGYKPKADITIEAVVGEEMMNTDAGTGATLVRGYKAEGAVVVEPSGPPYRLGIIPVSPGVFYLVITIKGKAVHASMRDELIRAGGFGAAAGVSSIDKAMIIYDGLRKLEEEWGQTKSHPMFTRPGHFTLHPGVITGGPAGAFVVSAESRIEYAVWHAPQEDPEAVKKEVEDQIARFVATDPWLRANPPKVEWPLWWPPFEVPVDAPICRAVHAAYTEALGGEPKYYGFAAVDDAAFLNLGGVPAITIGPGNLMVAHAPNEYVEISELVDAAKIYAMVIADWCGI